MSVRFELMASAAFRLIRYGGCTFVHSINVPDFEVLFGDTLEHFRILLEFHIKQEFSLVE